MPPAGTVTKPGKFNPPWSAWIETIVDPGALPERVTVPLPVCELPPVNCPGLTVIGLGYSARRKCTPKGLWLRFRPPQGDKLSPDISKGDLRAGAARRAGSRATPQDVLENVPSLPGFPVPGFPRVPLFSVDGLAVLSHEKPCAPTDKS